MPFRENVLMPFLLMTRNTCGKDAAKAMSSEWGGEGGAAIKERNKKVDDPHKQTMICILSCFSKSASELICWPQRAENKQLKPNGCDLFW